MIRIAFRIKVLWTVLFNHFVLAFLDRQLFPLLRGNLSPALCLMQHVGGVAHDPSDCRGMVLIYTRLISSNVSLTRTLTNPSNYGNDCGSTYATETCRFKVWLLTHLLVPHQNRGVCQRGDGPDAVHGPRDQATRGRPVRCEDHDGLHQCGSRCAGPQSSCRCWTDCVHNSLSCF